MLEAAAAALAAFVSTNIDDILILTVFFAQQASPARGRAVVLGQYLGVFFLTAASLCGALLLRFLPGFAIGLLGAVPIWLGVSQWLENRKQAGDAQTPQKKRPALPLAIQVAAVTIANGADNIGVYVPLFAGYAPAQNAAVCAVFAAMTALWCMLACRISRLPPLKSALEKHGKTLVPLLYIALGLYIFLKNGMLRP